MDIKHIKRQWTNQEIVSVLSRFKDRNDTAFNHAVDQISAIFISFDRDLDWLDNAEKKSRKTR
jgi:hypothetical protein